MDEVVPGLYEHYKGRIYEVVGVARHSETEEKLVVYRATYQDPTNNLWVRPLSMFCEDVNLGERSVLRFRRL